MFFKDPIKRPEGEWPSEAEETSPPPRRRTPDLGSPEENRIVESSGEVPCPQEGDNSFRDMAVRLAADLDNLRKRQRRESDRLLALERRAILGDLLEVLDSFDRALAMHGAENNQWLQGFEQTRAQLLDVLKRYGAQPFEAHGTKFDPLRHEAIATCHLPEFDEGTVVEVIQTGYELSDGTLLRPAKVVVVRHG